jgi:hypothetical protein
LRSEVKSTAAPKVERGTARPKAGAEEEDEEDEDEIEGTEAGLEDKSGTEGEEGLMETGAGDSTG